MKSLAIIPARGGSKRIPRKNVKHILGKPIIERTIETILESRNFSDVFVSTDDPEVMEIATEAGAQIPFTRPKSLSDDLTGTIPVIQHAIHSLQQDGWSFEAVCCIYPTAVLVSSQVLNRSYESFKQSDKGFLVPVLRYRHPIQRALSVGENGSLEMIDPQRFSQRTQDLPASFHDAGQFYWGTVETWLKSHSFFSSNTTPFELSPLEAQDIDSEVDWEIAELLLSKKTATRP